MNLNNTYYRLKYHPQHIFTNHQTNSTTSNQTKGSLTKKDRVFTQNSENGYYYSNNKDFDKLLTNNKRQISQKLKKDISRRNSQLKRLSQSQEENLKFILEKMYINLQKFAKNVIEQRKQKIFIKQLQQYNQTNPIHNLNFMFIKYPSQQNQYKKQLRQLIKKKSIYLKTILSQKNIFRLNTTITYSVTLDQSNRTDLSEMSGVSHQNKQIVQLSGFHELMGKLGNIKKLQDKWNKKSIDEVLNVLRRILIRIAFNEVIISKKIKQEQRNINFIYEYGLPNRPNRQIFESKRQLQRNRQRYYFPTKLDQHQNNLKFGKVILQKAKSLRQI